MNGCARVRNLLARWIEGETSPSESLVAARHVADCTACRILAARERRLAAALEDMRDAAPADEAFLARVMEALPCAPPAPADARLTAWIRRKRARLAIIAGAAALVGSGVPALAARPASLTWLPAWSDVAWSVSLEKVFSALATTVSEGLAGPILAPGGFDASPAAAPRVVALTAVMVGAALVTVAARGLTRRAARA